MLLETEPVIRALREELKELNAGMNAFADEVQKALILLTETNKKALESLDARLTYLEHQSQIAYSGSGEALQELTTQGQEQGGYNAEGYDTKST